MPKYNLSDLTLDEVSLVDTPANQSARVLLFKRQQPVSKSLDDVRLIVGFKKDGVAEVQSIKFGKAWTKEEASHFLEAHSFASNNVRTDEVASYYTQKDENNFNRLRVVVPGQEMLKAINADSGFNALQSAINEALQEKYPPPKAGNMYSSACAWVRDIIGDNVIYDYDGETYRCPFTVKDDGNGDDVVMLGPEVLVDIVYQDVTAKNAEPEIPAQVLFELGKMAARLKLFQYQVNKLESKKK